MLKFEHFLKCTPEMYSRPPPFQTSKCVTVDLYCFRICNSKLFRTVQFDILRYK